MQTIRVYLHYKLLNAFEVRDEEEVKERTHAQVFGFLDAFTAE